MADLDSGKGIQVLVPNEDHTFLLNENELKNLFLRNDVKDYPAVIISIAGAFRKGKSFILSFFLRYMHQRYNLKNVNSEWLGDKDEPLKGFSWRGGSERNTTGLLFWSQPFVATLDNGDKVVIYLMDTQGTFDSSSTVKDNATVFALSTMLSSVQIYNLSAQIEEDDLQHLQLFTDYGKLALEYSGGKPFQKLQLLVRDWSVPYEYSYGAEGGSKLLAKWLATSDGQHHEIQSLRNHIKSCFEDLACFLMPHPGPTVATNPNFKGSLKDIDKEFVENLKVFIPMLAAPENLIVKKIGGQTVKAKDLLLYFKTYMDTFSGTTLPEPKSILEATALANNLTAVAEAKEVYEKLMEEVCGGHRPYLSPALLLTEHQRARDKALHAFHSKKKMGGDEISDDYAKNLMKDLEQQYEEYKLRNDDKNVFRRLGTALVLLVLALVAWSISLLADTFCLEVLELLAKTLGIVCLMSLALWGYSRATGNYSQIAQILDEYATIILDQFQQSEKPPLRQEQSKEKRT